MGAPNILFLIKTILVFMAILSAVVCYYGLMTLFNEKEMESQQCLMSWMFPNFIRMSLPKNRFSYKYNLYLYKEGRNALRENDKGIRLDGVPVLFVHGNAGSYKQARSIGVATDMTQKEPYTDSHINTIKILSSTKDFNYTVGLDIFTIDFSEELAALNGHIMWDQAEFVNMCIEFILSLYLKNNHKSIIGVGHSMGGMLLRAAVLQTNYKKESIDTIITLSTPHKEHPFLLDRKMQQFYRKVNGEWKVSPLVEDIVVVSIGGGFRDNTIRSDSVTLEGVIPRSNGFSVLSYSIPNVRISTDHLSITWCKQFIQTIGFALLELVNSKKNPPFKYHLPKDERLLILEKHLKSNTRQNMGFSKEFKDVQKPSIDLSNFTCDPMVMEEQYYFFEDIKHCGIKLNIAKWRKKEKGTLVLHSNMDRLDFNVSGILRKQNQSKSDKGNYEKQISHSLNNYIEILPFHRPVEHFLESTLYPIDLPHIISVMDSNVLRDYDEVIITFGKNVKDYLSAKLSYSFINNKEITKTIKPKLQDLFLFKSTNFSLQNNEGFHNLSFPTLGRYFVYDVHLEYSEECRKKGDNVLLPSALYIAHIKEEKHNMSNPMYEERMIENATNFQVQFFTSTHRGFSILIFTPPSCRIEGSISLSWKGLFSHLLRFNLVQIISFILITLFFTLGDQAFNGWKIDFLNSLGRILFLRLVPSLMILFAIRNTSIVREIISSMDLIFTQLIEMNFASKSGYIALSPQDDLDMMHRFDNPHYSHTFYALGSVCVAVGILAALYLILRIISVFLGYILYYVFYPLIVAYKKLQSVSWIVICLLTTIGSTLLHLHTGLCLGILILLIMLHISSDFKFAPQITQGTRNLRFGMTMLCLVTGGLIVPSTICWVREFVAVKDFLLHQRSVPISQLLDLFFQQNDEMFALLRKLDSSSIFYVPLIWCVGLSCLKRIPMEEEETEEEKRESNVIYLYRWVFSAIFFELAALYMLLLGLFAVYRVHYTLPFISVCVVINCLVSRKAEKIKQE